MNTSPAHHGSSDADPMHGRFVPLRDAPREQTIYDGSLVTLALLGASAGGIILGWLGYAVAEGPLPVAGLGQFAGAGWGVATFVGAGVGVSLGALAGGLIGLFRMPRAKTGRPDDEHAH